jgi:hypothetical protein
MNASACDLLVSPLNGSHINLRRAGTFEMNSDRKPGRNSLTYKDAGVDIDAGDALVDRIAPLAKATRRPGADADLGGFGGLFDLKAAGFKDPVLVAVNDGVGTKLKIAIDTGISFRDRVRISSRCASTTSSCRAPSRCSFSTISRPASSMSSRARS